jgi:hypothetical protein
MIVDFLFNHNMLLCDESQHYAKLVDLFIISLKNKDPSGNRYEMTDFFSNDKKTGGLKGHTILCCNP